MEKLTTHREDEQLNSQPIDIIKQQLTQFPGLNVSAFSYLDSLSNRLICPGCKQPRKYFCYDCYTIMGDASQIPQLKLEVKVDMYAFVVENSFRIRIHHPKELKSKSTAIHAKVLAPGATNYTMIYLTYQEDVIVYEFPDFPDYSKHRDDVLLLFPSDVR